MNDDEKNIAHQREMFERGERRRILKLIAEKEAADTTLRNQFAAAALTGLLATDAYSSIDATRLSFMHANLMIEESKK